MKCRVAKKVLFKACTKGPFNYKKTTIVKAYRENQKTSISVRDAWLVTASVFVIVKHGDIASFLGTTNMELAT